MASRSRRLWHLDVCPSLRNIDDGLMQRRATCREQNYKRCCALCLEALDHPPTDLTMMYKQQLHVTNGQSGGRALINDHLTGRVLRRITALYYYAI